MTKPAYKLIKPVQKKSKLGFSFIEIGLVALIIGILGVGATAGSSIIKSAKLKSAQSITRSSPVVATNGLSLWLDATSQKGFANNIVDGNAISSWNDSSPINATGTKAFQDTLSSQPIYISNGINNLPSVSFIRNSNKCLSVSTGFDDNTENVTIFVVWRPTTNGNTTLSLLEKYSSNSSAYPYSLASYSSGYVFAASDSSASPAANGTITKHNDVPHIVSAMRAKNGLMRIWVNGVQDPADGADNTTEPTVNNASLFIGCKPSSSQYLDGDIGEVIIFSRILKNQERKDIEEYLSTKWAIKLGITT